MKNNGLLILIIVTIVFSCSKKDISSKSFQIDRSEIIYGGGNIISANPFHIQRKNGELYIREEGGVGGINLKNPEFDRLYDANIKVTESTKAILIIDYPLEKSIAYEVYNEKGFGKKELVCELNKVYSELYSEKEKYKISCEDYSDLELTMITVFEKAGKIYLDTKVESKIEK
jgi:hypothetical protein